MDEWFDKTFKQFYLQITLYNYAKIKNIPLKKELIELEKNLKVMIPIINRFVNDPNISLENLTKSKNTNTNTQTINNKKNDIWEIDEHSPFIDKSSNNSDTQVANNNNSNADTSEEEVVDEIGNKQVEELTTISLELLKKIKESGWSSIEIAEEDEDDDDDDNDNDDDNEEDNDDDKNEADQDDKADKRKPDNENDTEDEHEDSTGNDGYMSEHSEDNDSDTFKRQTFNCFFDNETYCHKLKEMSPNVMDIYG